MEHEEIIETCESCNVQCDELRHGLCEECFDETYTSCESCGDLVERDSSDECITPDSEIYCASCFRREYTTCDHCHEDVRRDDMRADVCDSCYDMYYTYCDDCETLIRQEDSFYEEDSERTLCGDCYRESDVIHNYSYKPRAVFFGKGPRFLGVELEVENKSRRRTADIANALSNPDDLYYLKEDGSLDNGFEIVSHPFSWEWLQKHPDAFDHVLNLRDKGVRSYDTHTCGMHVHISKKAFRALHLYKFLKFFASNPDFIFHVSRRRSREAMDQWAKCEYTTSTWDDRLNRCVKRAESLTKIAKARCQSGGRYQAVNLENDSTVEVRIFRGTLDPKGFRRNLEFVIAAFEFTLAASVRTLSADAFISYVSQNRKAYPNLNAFLNRASVAEDSDEMAA